MRLVAAVCVMGLSVTLNTSFAGTDANNCAEKSKQLKKSERQAYIKSCMDQLSSPANVKEKEQANKRAICEQNAKNQHLDGNAKANYLSECVNKNEAVEVAKATETHTPPPAKKENPKAAPVKSASNNNGGNVARNCAMRADKKGLKGAERKKFIKTCAAG